MSCNFPPPPEGESLGPSLPSSHSESSSQDDTNEQSPIRLKVYPTCCVHVETTLRAAVLSLLPKDAPSFTQVGQEAMPLPALLLSEKELAQLILFLQETLSEVRALPLSASQEEEHV